MPNTSSTRESDALRIYRKCDCFAGGHEVDAAGVCWLQFFWFFLCVYVKRVLQPLRKDIMRAGIYTPYYVYIEMYARVKVVGIYVKF